MKEQGKCGNIHVHVILCLDNKYSIWKHKRKPNHFCAKKKNFHLKKDVHGD